VRLIPVIDVREGLAVHAVAGERATYRPLRSVLTASHHPATVAADLQRALGNREFYVADLDSIEGRTGARAGVPTPATAALVDWATAAGVSVLLDAGVADAATARALAAREGLRVVVGTETLPAPGVLGEIVAAVGRERVVASLDLRAGRTVSPAPELAGRGAEDAGRLLAAQGIDELIVLDLARVGTQAGALPEVAALVRACPGVAVLVGGGVRVVADLLALEGAGAAGALVATALHRGTLAPGEWQRRGASPPSTLP
jgi:phosphoribosylformimino-5-aminoimidazole carboxamide ribotide isomerase